jgi:hypothetical protein
MRFTRRWREWPSFNSMVEKWKSMDQLERSERVRLCRSETWIRTLQVGVGCGKVRGGKCEIGDHRGEREQSILPHLPVWLTGFRQRSLKEVIWGESIWSGDNLARPNCREFEILDYRRFHFIPWIPSTPPISTKIGWHESHHFCHDFGRSRQPIPGDDDRQSLLSVRKSRE